MSTTMIHARIDSTLKNQATAIFSEMGLTMSDAFRLMVIKTTKEKTLPFEIWTPNKKTAAAMTQLRAGKGHRADSIAAMMKELKK